MLNSLRQMLLGDEAASAAFHEHLALLGFHDCVLIGERIHALSGSDGQVDEVAASLMKLVSLLSESEDPAAGLGDFERFRAARIGDRGFAGFRFLNENPRAIEMLVRLFTSSRYLTETLLRNPASLRELIQHRRLADLKCREEFLEHALTVARAEANHAARLDALRRFQRTEILRIGACDLFGLIDLRAATVQLSLLADSLVQACLLLTAADLPVDPKLADSHRLGKLGGEELNYSSDIDLVFLTNRQPSDVMPLAQRLIKAMQDATAEGFLYRVDMRLRPWGRSGELVATIPSYVEYIQNHAEMWEKQALLKLPASIAGNRRPSALGTIEAGRTADFLGDFA